MEDCANMGTEPTKWACVDLDDFHVPCGISADFQRCWGRRTCHAMLSLRSWCTIHPSAAVTVFGASWSDVKLN